MNRILKNKQIISMLLLLIVLFGAIPVEVFALNNREVNKNKVSTEDMFIYEDGDNTKLIEFKGNVDIVNIPDNVKTIGESAFKNKHIKQLNLNEGLEVIEDEAFSNNQIFGKVVFHSSLKHIGERAFADNLIQSIDLSKTSDLKLGKSVFQDNKISGKLDLSNIEEVSERAFMSNEIEDLIFSDEVKLIGKESFVENKLSKISINSNEVNLEKDAFASNGQFVEIVSNNIHGDRSTNHMYGHIVNPVNIVIRSIEKQKDGSLKRVLSDKMVKFDPYNADNFFALNEMSFYEPDYILGYTIDKNIHSNRLISFTPDKDSFILDVYYTKIPNPEIKLNQEVLQKLLKDKKEGSNISQEELLSLVNAYDYLGNDISKDIVVSPTGITNAEAKEYSIVYSVKDAKGRQANHTLTLPIAIDPLKIKIANTEWQLEDFLYDGNRVYDLSDLGKLKAKTVSGLAVPHMNPYTMENIEVVDFGNEEKEISRLVNYISEGNISFGNPEAIKSINDYSFRERKIGGQLPEMPNLEYVGNGAFEGTQISSFSSKMPKLEYIGNNAFYYAAISGQLPDMPNLKYIGKKAFNDTQIGGQLPDMPKLEYIGDRAFQGTQISGFSSDMPKLEYIGNVAFFDTKVSGQLPEMPNLKHIGNTAFYKTQISGQLPDMPKLEYIGDGAFRGTDISGQLPDMPNLKHIGDRAFLDTQVSGQLPEMPNLKHIGDRAFLDTQVSGQFPDMPNIEYIGDVAFFDTKVSGQLPPMPKLEYIGSVAFMDTEISGQLPEMPNLKHIGANAFRDTDISGQLPDMPNLKHIGDRAFLNTKISTDQPFYINNNIKVDKETFNISDDSTKKMILLTYNGEDAPNVPLSDYHILNPYNIGFIGKNSSGETVFDEKRILATKDGDNIKFKLPKVDGYIDSGEISISKTDLINETYTYVYESIKDKLDEEGGNKYGFTFKPTNTKKYYNDNETINSYLYLSTANEEVLTSGKIVLRYDKNVYKDFFIPEIKGINNIAYKEGEVLISLNSNLSQGTEIGLPVSFQFREGLIPKKLFSIDGLLYNGSELKGYGLVEYGVNYKDPIYNSVYSDKSKTKYQNIVLQDLSEDYEREIVLYPETKALIRDFNSFRVEYDILKYKNKNGWTVNAKLLSPEWKTVGNKYVYEVNDYKGEVSIPPLKLEINNPASTDKAIIINSKVVAEVNTNLEEYKDVEISDTNYLNIYVEKKSGNILSKDINGPHSSSRHAYFYDNIVERDTDFKWNLFYNVTYDMKELVLTDHQLDNRMKYTGVDPNGERVLIRLLDKNNKVLLEQTISDTLIFNEDIQEKISSIELKYFNLKDGQTIKPKVITKLKDINKNYFSPENIGNINKFYNHVMTRALDEDGKIMIGKDYAFVDVVADNSSLATEVKITSKPVDLSYGKIANTAFYLKSKEFFNKELEGFKYTALIAPSHRVEDIILNSNILGKYEISQTKNGYTKVDFDFTNTNIHLLSNTDSFKLFDIKTTPKDKSSKDLVAHGFLYLSNEYEIFGQSSGILEGLDKEKFSYDEAKEEIINGEFFSIRKLIGKEDEVSTRVKTEKGKEFFYRFEIDNGTKTSRENFELIDILPFKDDYNNSNYHNKIDVEKAKKIALPTGFKIEYLNQKDFITVNKNNIIKQLSNANWSTTPTAETKAIKITTDKIESKGDLIQIDIPMITNSGLKVEDNLKINTNQFAYKHSTLGYEQALSNPVEQYAEVEAPKRNIKLTKASYTMGEKDGVLEGVKFAIKDTFGQVVSIQTSDKNGEIIFNDIIVGDYTIEEMSVPEGYKNNKVLITVRAEDMNKASTVLDLGEVRNDRIDKFDYLFKNVEFMDDLQTITYRDLKHIYGREIAGGKFKITNTNTREEQVISIDSRSGNSITLQPGIHAIEQVIAPKDNGLAYKLNDIKYTFEIDKFGKILLGDGYGNSLTNKKEESSKIIYFPNTIDYKTSTVNIKKLDQDGKNLSGAEFTLQNIETGKITVATSNSSGSISFNNVKPGLYSVKESKAPKGYISTGQVEIIEVPINEEKTFNFTFTNQKLRVNIHKYKVVADKLLDKSQAEEIAKNSFSSTGGKFIVKDLGDFYQVREVWKDNKVSVDGDTFHTDENGSIYNIQETIDIDVDSVLNINNSTKIKNHYEPNSFEEHMLDYVVQENFNGVIDIDIIVKPLKGSIYVSKYVIDKNSEIGNKAGELTNGARYTLLVDKGHGFEEMDTKEIDNSNYLVFNDLDPNYKYKVREVYVPEGQEEANPKEYDVVLSDINKYTTTVVFRNYIELEAGTVYLNKVDGRTEEALQGVEFEIVDKHGVSNKYTTDSQGKITFEELRHDLAPYTIKETKAAPGYRISSQTIKVTEEDILNEKTFIAKNYKYNDTPKTGTNGKLPFFLVSIPLIVLAYVFSKKKY